VSAILGEEAIGEAKSAERRVIAVRTKRERRGASLNVKGENIGTRGPDRSKVRNRRPDS